MPSIRDHSERVYRIAHQSSAAVTSPVAASWRRCMTLHGLAPEEARSPWRLSEIEFRQARESSGALIAEAAGELDRLFATVGKAGCCLLLTDGKGVALERRGAGGDDADFRGIGLWSGTVWSEASVGTNGIGTAIADERPVLIQRDQHFLSRNIGLSCATAPIRDESGKLAAAIDISTCRDDASEATLSILSQAVRDAAARIEANLFRRAFVGARIVLVPVDRAGPALLAVDRDDLVLGATRAARLWLGLDDERIAAGVPASDLLQEDLPGEGGELPDAERAALRRALSRAKGNVSMAADLLGISRATLYRKMKRLALN
ncbi:sigma-54-dependent Fis family transcriptional regulator [Sinorhizobium meliloti WSM1022]|jgi:transcriptional regulator of acetoin/glycerol metabolism|uniref:Fis family transcriptional regulator n=4 Tax=Sinorhizobium TaxID=28105 RepID=H0G5H0_RHIML|nr:MULTISPECIES: helix-turn-helix domain-containing protein [Sinorhizobium]ASQ03316.1 sigma-54-dependent Fis family transcriptional regulator [Sinorhizobium meliloti]EHK75412.1 Fis family transcriptional regulator [Sinorhizobium meliloti CCNWSX0020]MCO6422800.1 GAF domain-containing protein [Sinorhizobium meliloti]MDW9357884.1 GAF domain-containing protein [Sinorhizobium meliloti]MDW9407681.1 GAF domain-containing protein [Sinorhizobium meliloti]